MDNQILKTLKIFYGYPAGFSTGDFYAEYVKICNEDNVTAKPKSQVIKEVCAETRLGIEERRIKYFRRDD